VPQNYKTDDDFRLGSWLSNQRRKKGSLSSERKSRLEQLPSWVWDAQTEKWEIGYRYLKEYGVQEGHCSPSVHYKAKDGYQLGGWVSEQRKSKDSLTFEYKTRLEALPGWVWRVK
jgi:hypothetical protein